MNRLKSIGALLFTVTLLQAQSHPFQSWGFDAELLTYGGSFGGIWHLDLNPNWALSLESNWTLVESGTSYEYYDRYTGRLYKLNNQNLSMLKAMGGVSVYPFAGDLDPSFQFGFYGGFGPILAMDTDNNSFDLARWRHVRGYPSIYGKLAMEFKVHQSRTGTYLLRVGYDFTQFRARIDGKQVYQGIFLQFGMEFPRFK